MPVDTAVCAAALCAAAGACAPIVAAADSTASEAVPSRRPAKEVRFISMLLFDGFDEASRDRPLASRGARKILFGVMTRDGETGPFGDDWRRSGSVMRTAQRPRASHRHRRP